MSTKNRKFEPSGPVVKDSTAGGEGSISWSGKFRMQRGVAKKKKERKFGQTETLGICRGETV